MIKKIVLLVILALFTVGFSFAQERLTKKGNDKYEEYSFSPAIDIYKKVLEKGYTSADLLGKLGNSYYFNADYKEAADTYKKLVEEFGSNLSPEYYFRYAQALKSLGDYEASDALMLKFIEITSNDSRASVYKNKLNYLEEIEKNSGRYDLSTFEYNSPYSDFAPSFYKKGLIFSSDRDTGNFARYRHTWNSRDFLDLYKIGADSTSEKRVEKLGENVNTRWHESTTVTTKDGNTLYFTRNNVKEGKYVRDEKGMIRLKVFRAELINGIWSNIEELPFNSDSYSVAHPALSTDGKTLFFASDMPGSYGASDIFKASINSDRTFGTPINLGDKINTESRETFPFITNKEVLYFSSDGHPGLGGLDVFATKIAFNDYNGTIVNVGRPINSSMDDFTFVLNEDTHLGYFASNRADGQGEDDIYGFLETVPLILDCNQQISGTVRDKISNEVLVGATVKIIDENNIELLTTVTNSDGKYILSLDCHKGNFVRALMQGYVPSEEYLGKSEGKPNIVDFYLERDRVIAGFGDDLAKLLQLSTIYFGFDKYNIRKDSEIEVQKVIAAMEKYPSLKIKVNSHTDSRGRDAYNLWLSQKRAESTVDYMVSKGIARNRLKGEGFGETKLVNGCVNGVKCSDILHADNRRSEFIILE